MRQLSILSDGEETTIAADLDVINSYCRDVIGVVAIAQRDIKKFGESAIPVSALLQIINQTADKMQRVSRHIMEQYHARDEYFEYHCNKVAPLPPIILPHYEPVDHGEPVYDASDLITKAEV